MRVKLNDRSVAALKPAKRGPRYDVLDALMPGLAVHVTDKGSKTFVFRTRFPGNKNSRRLLGKVGAMSVEQARAKARDWHQMLDRGIDPGVRKVRAEQAVAATQLPQCRRGLLCACEGREVGQGQRHRAHRAQRVAAALVCPPNPRHRILSARPRRSHQGRQGTRRVLPSAHLMPTPKVRFRVPSRSHMLTLSFSGFDDP
jgi:hypothetical protein